MRRALTHLVFAAALLVAGAARAGFGELRVYVLNGLTDPVSISFDGRAPLTVGSGQRASTLVPTGPAHVTVRQGERVIADETMTIPEGQAFVAYNVLGAAPLYLERVHYSTSPRRDAAPDFRMLCGKSLVTVGSVDYIFREVPKEVSSSRRYGELIRTKVDLVGNGRWVTTAQMLFDLEKYADAAKVLGEVVRIEKLALAPLIAATDKSQGEARTLELLRELIAERPEWYDAHRLLQAKLRGRQGIEAARTLYRERLAAHPESPFEQLLFARLDESRPAEVTLRKLLAAHPDDRRVARYLAVVLGRAERWGEVAQILDRLPADDEGARSYRDLHLTALVAAGRMQEARKAALASVEEPFLDVEDVSVAALAVRAADSEASAEALIDAVNREDLDKTLIRLLVGMPKPAGSSESRAAKLVRAAIRGPAPAWDALGTVNEKLAPIGEQLRLLLAADFHRMGDATRSNALLMLGPLPIPAEAIYAYVERGEEGPDLRMIEPRNRAPLYLARALALEAAGKSGAKLRARAARADVLDGFVACAAKAWPRGVAPREDKENEPITFRRVRGVGDSRSEK